MNQIQLTNDEVVDIGEATIRKLRQYDDTAVIAGGWARDQLLDRDIRDIDIWMTKRISKAKLLELFPNGTKFRMFSKGLADRLVCVSKLTIKGAEVDFIVVNKDYIPEGGEIVHTFDFGLCQSWSVGDGLIHGTPQFWEDMGNCTISFNPTKYNLIDLERIMRRHYGKMKKKFPDYTFKGLPEDALNYAKSADDQPQPGGLMKGLLGRAGVPGNGAPRPAFDRVVFEKYGGGKKHDADHSGL
jgi:hypothetical protein